MHELEEREHEETVLKSEKDSLGLMLWRPIRVQVVFTSCSGITVLY